MTDTFIRNEHLNFIKKQIALIKDSRKKHVPPNVMAATIDLANAKISALFSNASQEQLEMLDLSKLKTEDDYEAYMERLSERVHPFQKITEQQMKKMFSKNKKLKLPNLTEIDYNKLTYLGWNEIRVNKKFIVYELEGRMVGIECKVTPTSKKNFCCLCNSFGEVEYCSTVTKTKKAKNPDYYRAIGNLICTDSRECNHNITDVTYLQSFLKDSLGV